ncbi:MAG: hypothetical protein PHV37_02720 [Candidatus Gastranaerophilales bacterium]|nr:hypothetical protein [Candidatus Gastranaerophilales bacterium]
MKKSLITLLVLATTTASIATAATNPWNVMKKDLKKANQETKTKYKNIGENYKKNASEQAKANKQARVKALQAQREAAIESIDSKIATKKQAIKAVKKQKLSQAQEAAKLNVLQRELNYLEQKRNTIKSNYNKQIDALKI